MNTDIAKIAIHLHPLKCATESALCELLGRDNDYLSTLISEMKELGYDMNHDGDMWCMKHVTRKLLPWELCRNLGTSVIGKHVEYFDSIDSTQDYALDIAKESDKNGHVIVASVQHSGRGRRTRRWVSPDGGVWMSVIMQSDSLVNQTNLLPLAASCALCDAIQDVINVKTSIVWPNDLVVSRNGKLHKVAGMIIDVVADNDKIKSIILGVGINFQVDEKTINKTIHDESVLPAASLVETTSDIVPLKTVQAFFQNLEHMCSMCDKLGHIAAEFSKRSTMIGRKVSVKTENSVTSGIVRRIDDDGALVINDGNTDVRFISGQVIRVL